MARDCERLRWSYRGIVRADGAALHYTAAGWSTEAVVEIGDIPPGTTLNTVAQALAMAGSIELFEQNQYRSYAALTARRIVGSGSKALDCGIGTIQEQPEHDPRGDEAGNIAEDEDRFNADGSARRAPTDAGPNLDIVAQDRFALTLALHALGHANPSEIIDRAQAVADQMAAWEEAGEPRAEGEHCPEADEAARIQENFPAVWEWVTGGHAGGGGATVARGADTAVALRQIVADARELMAHANNSARAVLGTNGMEPAAVARMRGTLNYFAAAIAKAEGKA